MRKRNFEVHKGGKQKVFSSQVNRNYLPNRSISVLCSLLKFEDLNSSNRKVMKNFNNSNFPMSKIIELNWMISNLSFLTIISSNKFLLSIFLQKFFTKSNSWFSWHDTFRNFASEYDSEMEKMSYLLIYLLNFCIFFHPNGINSHFFRDCPSVK